jgi:hypothetical protein
MDVSDAGDQPRLEVGYLDVKHGSLLEVWAGCPETKKNAPREPITTAKIKLYHVSRTERGICELECNPEVRKDISWAEGLRKLFDFHRLVECKKLKTAVQVQNAIILSIIKVLLRFPGLMVPVDVRKHKRRMRLAKRHPEFMAHPFDRSDRHDRSPLPENPYKVALDIVNFVSSPADKVHRCHPPDQQTISGIVAVRENVSALGKRKRQ